MSVLIPTAEGPPPQPVPPAGRRAPWLAAIIVVLAVVTLVAIAVSRDERAEDEQVAPASAPGLEMQQWEPIVFPGAGVFIDLATGPGGTVAVTLAGTDWLTIERSSHVWFSAADSDSWRWVDVDASPDARIDSVVMRGETLFAAGSFDGGLINPAVWSGTPQTGLEVIAEPFPAPGNLHLIRDLDDQLVVVGMEFDSVMAPTAPIVLRQSPGAWTVITPAAATEVHEIITTGTEWIAVGTAERRRPAIWHSQDEGTTWTERPVPAVAPATVTDVIQVGSDVFAVTRLNPATTVRALLLRYAADEWQAVGEPRTLPIHWLASVRGELIGGPDSLGRDDPESPYLWRHNEYDGWTSVAMPRSTARGHFGTAFTTASNALVAGTLDGQPTLWMPSSGTTPTITAAVVSRQWERIAVTPPDTERIDVLPDGRMVATVWPYGPFETGEPQILISADGTEWRNLALPPGLDYGGVHAIGDRLVLVGMRDSTVVIGSVDENEFVELAHVDGGDLVSVDTEDDELIVYFRVTRSAGRMVVPADPDGAITIQELSWNPIFIQGFEEGLVVGGGSSTMDWPADTLRVSTDRGESWTELDVEPWILNSIGSDLIVIGAPDETSYRLTLDPPGLEPIDLPDALLSAVDAWDLTGWGGGLAAFYRTGRILLLSELDGDVRTIELSPATGFDGVFLFQTGDHHVVAVEQGELVLYEWTGHAP